MEREAKPETADNKRRKAGRKNLADERIWKALF